MASRAPSAPHRRTAALAAIAAAAMLATGFAAVPLYRLFCQKTGYGGTPAMAAPPTVTPAK